MSFEERFNQILKERGASKAALARILDIPQSTFMYKSKRLDAWKVPEFNKLVTELRLTDEEVTFLTSEVD